VVLRPAYTTTLVHLFDWKEELWTDYLSDPFFRAVIKTSESNGALFCLDYQANFAGGLNQDLTSQPNFAD